MDHESFIPRHVGLCHDESLIVRRYVEERSTTCATCGHILSQSRSNFNSINSKQGAAITTGGSEVLCKRDWSRLSAQKKGEAGREGIWKIIRANLYRQKSFYSIRLRARLDQIRFDFTRVRLARLLGEMRQQVGSAAARREKPSIAPSPGIVNAFT